MDTDRPPPLKLSAAAKEELADAKLLFTAAAHNVQVLLHGDEALAALDAALAMGEQALSTLKRIRTKLG
jgi:hypothetical protein